LPGERGDPRQIREAVPEVAAGRALLQPEIASKLAESMARPELSERELQVLQYMALGRSNKEMGVVRYISENTVKGHVSQSLQSWMRSVAPKLLPSQIGAGLYKRVSLSCKVGMV
jgi:DNA-binding NarL/FixJ family response regulator